MIGTRNEQGGPMTIPQAEISKDPKVQEVLRKAQEGSDKMMRGLIEITALTGSDMDEVVSSARQILPDLINKRSKAGMPNPYLQNPDELNMITQQMVKLASVLKMSDPGGRPLKWHMVALQELFSGTSGGEKDKGREAVRSLRAREGIKMTDEEASTLAQAVNTGDLVRASQIIEATLERSGQGLQNLSNLLAKTLKPNVDGTITALKLFGKDFTEYIHKDLIADFTTLRVLIFEVFKDPRYKSAMIQLSKMFSQSFNSIRLTVLRYLQMLIDDPNVLVTKLTPVIKNFENGVKALSLAIQSIALFLEGFFGAEAGLEGLATTMESIKNNSKKAGEETRKFVKELSGLVAAISPSIATLTWVFEKLNEAINKLLSPFTFMASIFGGDLGEGINKYRALTDQQRAEMSGHDRMRMILGERAASAALNMPFQFIKPGPAFYNPDVAKIPQTPYRTDTMGSIKPIFSDIYNPGWKLPSTQPSATPAIGQQQSSQKTQSSAIQYSLSSKFPFITQMPNIPKEAVIEAFKVAKPIKVEARQVDQSVKISIAEMNVTSSDANDFSNQLKNVARKNTTQPKQRQFSADDAAARGLLY
jgi:hypothetical protein